MAKYKNDSTLPKSMEEDMEPSSSITYANEVIAIIAGLAASEVEGIAGMVNVNSGLKGKNKNVTRGVKVEVGTEEVSVDLYLNVEYGTPIQRAAHDAQESVKKSIESMTGLHVVKVDVHVMGVSFEKENNLLQTGADKAVLEAGEPARGREPAPKMDAEPDDRTETEDLPEKTAGAKEAAKPEEAEPVIEFVESEISDEAEPEEEDSDGAEPVKAESDEAESDGEESAKEEPAEADT